MRTIGMFAAILICLSSVKAADEAIASGLKDAKVGDWVEYKMKVAAKGHDMEMSQKRTVTAKDDKSITMKMEVTVMGRAMPGHDMTIPLDKPYHPGVNDPDAKVEKLEEGDEKLTIGGKDYDTHWYRYKGTNKKGDAVEGKVWLAKGISLGGMVKMEGTTDRGNVTMELTDFGGKK
jgi:hypothetical protein